VFVGPKILPREEGMENLARYIIRASFSQERMTYLPDESKVIYESKDGKKEKVFEVLEWLATMDSHVPGQGRTDGAVTSDFSNVCYLILNGNLQFALMKRSEVLKSLKWSCDRRDLEKKRTSS
jgi:hypothetical protein